MKWVSVILIRESSHAQTKGGDYQMDENIKVEATTEAPAAQNAVMPKPAFKTYQIIYYILGLVEILLAFRFVFRLLGANQGSGFVSFIYSITGVFMAPFRAIFPTIAEGVSALEWSILVAMVVYATVAWGLAYLLRIMTVKHTTA